MADSSSLTIGPKNPLLRNGYCARAISATPAMTLSALGGTTAGWTALTVADVEFLKRRISVHRNAVQVGQPFEVGQTKGKENRMVPVAASVLSRLAVRSE